MRLLFAGSLATILVCAQTESQAQKGAKAIFYDAGAGTEAQVTTSTAKAQRARSASTTASVHPILGLKLGIELRQSDGTVQQVTPTRVFHSGDRIRLHVTSNVDGNLVIYQRQAEKDNKDEQLFPAPQISGATGHVVHGADVVLPTEKGWFRFDDQPGQIHLTLVLTAQGKEGDSSSSGTLASAATAHSMLVTAKGSKALIIEDDPVDQKAQYQVMDSRLDSKIPAGVIATEVMLSHGR